MHLIERVYKAIETDEDNQAKQSARIAGAYLQATPEQQQILDRVFIALCGWSLKTLLDGGDDHKETVTAIETAVQTLQTALDYGDPGHPLPEPLYGRLVAVLDELGEIHHVLKTVIEEEDD